MTLQFVGLTKRYGPVTAVDDLTAEVASGQITAFLGSNGSGKTTTMRMLLGLTRPTAGRALVDGTAYADLAAPMRVIGAVLDQGFHPHRTARNHLRVTALQAGVSARRVDEVIHMMGLEDVAGRRAGGFSLGQRQRLALAAALLGEPQILVMDEPFNGLDPAGITTLRDFLRSFAERGGTVLLSSHLLSEIELIADATIIIDQGRLLRAGPLQSLIPAGTAVSVTSPDVVALANALVARGATVEPAGPDQVVVRGHAPDDIGHLAAENGFVIVAMATLGRDLESLFASLTTHTVSTEVRP